MLLFKLRAITISNGMMFFSLLRNLDCLFLVRSQYLDSCIHHTVIIMLATESKYQEFNNDNYELHLVINLFYL